MNKKLIQSFVVIAMLLGMFATTGAAFAAGCGTSVTVVSGDTLRKIANRCGTTISALQRANPEIGNGNLIYPGQNLLLPGTVLRIIANKFGTTVDALLRLNPKISNQNLIYVGQVVTVR